jgi:hypothetical protein
MLSAGAFFGIMGYISLKGILLTVSLVLALSAVVTLPIVGLTIQNIRAIALNTLRQALRMKVAATFIVLLLVLLPIIGLTATGDGTLKGKLQTFLSYGLSLTSLLLCLLTVIVSIYSVTSDIEQKQIYTVITKPVHRIRLILGKLLGVLLLDMGLLVLFAAIIYSITIYLPDFHGANFEERNQLRNEFYTARASVVPKQIDVSKEVEESYKKLEASGQLEQVFPSYTRKEIMAQLSNRARLMKQAAPVGRELVWEFHNIKPLDPNESIFVKFKYDVSVTPPDSQVYSQWLIGDYRQIRYGAQSETPLYRDDRKDPIRTFREMEVPADAIAQDGYLAVAFLNIPLNNTVVIFPIEDGLEVLYKADSFTANFVRACILILFRLIFLSCLALLAASFLSFPVAILLCLAVFLTGTLSGFILESLDFLSANVGGVYSYTVRPLIKLLPRFDEFNPAKFLVSARLLSWSLVGKVAAFMVCIKSLLLLIFALIIFKYREIARIVV